MTIPSFAEVTALCSADVKELRKSRTETQSRLRVLYLLQSGDDRHGHHGLESCLWIEQFGSLPRGS